MMNPLELAASYLIANDAPDSLIRNWQRISENHERTSAETQKEYEQRWELKTLPDGLDDPSEIEQGFLFQKPSYNLRVRKEKPHGGEPVFTMTCKFLKKSDEAEVEITKEMFERLWQEVEPDTKMRKTRWRYEGGWVVDEVLEPAKKKGIFAEMETETKDEEVDVPEKWDVVKKIQ